MTPEVYFVHDFIKKEYQEQLLGDLLRQDKRNAALARFCDAPRNWFDAAMLIKEPLEQFVVNEEKEAVIISADRYLNGMQTSMQDGVKLVLGLSEAAIVITKGAAVVVAEAGKEKRKTLCVKR